MRGAVAASSAGQATSAGTPLRGIAVGATAPAAGRTTAAGLQVDDLCERAAVGHVPHRDGAVQRGGGCDAGGDAERVLVPSGRLASGRHAQRRGAGGGRGRDVEGALLGDHVLQDGAGDAAAVAAQRVRGLEGHARADGGASLAHHAGDDRRHVRVVHRRRLTTIPTATTATPHGGVQALLHDLRRIVRRSVRAGDALLHLTIATASGPRADARGLREVGSQAAHARVVGAVGAVEQAVHDAVRVAAAEVAGDVLVVHLVRRPRWRSVVAARPVRPQGGHTA